jgi:transcriptional regulator with XRE-family HTH domain
MNEPKEKGCTLADQVRSGKASKSECESYVSSAEKALGLQKEIEELIGLKSARMILKYESGDNPIPDIIEKLLFLFDKTESGYKEIKLWLIPEIFNLITKLEAAEKVREEK